MDVLFECMYMYYMCAVARMPEEHFRSPITGIKDDYKLLYGCWNQTQIL